MTPDSGSGLHYRKSKLYAVRQTDGKQNELGGNEIKCLKVIQISLHFMALKSVDKIGR